VREPDGLGVLWFIPIIVAVAAAAGSAAATRLISGPSSPSQRQIEEQMRLQQRLEIERMLEQERIQRGQTEQIVSYAPLALGAVALVMLLR
jgi:hypothetical protein